MSNQDQEQERKEAYGEYDLSLISIREKIKSGMTEYELIDMPRMRTAMYIGCLSPTHLQSFLFGCSSSLFGYISKKDRDIKPEEPKFYRFFDWVANKFNYSESTSGWAYMIEDQREDKEEALDLFYELLDEYRGIKHQEIAKIKFNHEDKIDRSWRGYSRLKKVRGTFDEVFKPSPHEIMIRQMNYNGNWFQMVAKNENNDILFTWNSEGLEEVYKRANEIFGIEKEEWIHTKEDRN